MTVNDIKKLLVGFAKQTTQVHVGAEPPTNASTNIWIDTSVEKAWDSDAPANVYSTEEIIVGRWIDGRPIYRQVVSLNNVATANKDTVVADVSTLNIDTCVTLDVLIAGRVGNFARSANTNVYYELYYYNNNLCANVGASFLNKGGSALLEYTKTTDTAQ